MPRKSFYVFLTALLGTLLFLMLHRIIVFFYLYLIAGGYVGSDFDYYQFLFWDYFTLILTMMLGAWYGISLGLHWFNKVYEEKSHGGLIHHVATNYFPGARPKDLPGKMAAVRERLETDLWQLEDLAKASLEHVKSPPPIKRTVVRKRRTVKKTTI